MQEEQRKVPPTRLTNRETVSSPSTGYAQNLTQSSQGQSLGQISTPEDSINRDSNRDKLDESLEEIEEGTEEFVGTSKAIVLVVEDHVIRAEQRKEDFLNRSIQVQKRMDDLLESRLRRELTKNGLR